MQAMSADRRSGASAKSAIFLYASQAKKSAMHGSVSDAGPSAGQGTCVTKAQESQS